MNSRERNAWNRSFALTWKQLQLQARGQRRPIVPLNTELAIAARKFRDQGHNPESTARGLYMGTEHARAAQS